MMHPHASAEAFSLPGNASAGDEPPAPSESALIWIELLMTVVAIEVRTFCLNRVVSVRGRQS
jgi:hypothetical protein